MHIFEFFLMNQPISGEANPESTEYLSCIDELFSYDLLIIDDYGLIKLNMLKCRLLFSLQEETVRYVR